MKRINIGLIGFGNVGSGVVKILRERRALLAEKIGLEIIVRKICDKNISSPRRVHVDKSLLCRNAAQVITDPQIDIVVELMGGLNPAKEYIMEAMNKGKHVVTANKALLSQEGNEIFAYAKDKGKNIYFEASVGAGIPIIKALREGLVANRFSSIYGILNGTSNFVLSEMSAENANFSEALRQAKLKGFAEKNPTLDIEGFDSAHKLLLLSYLCFGRLYKLEEVFVEGISRISLADINYAREMGFSIKLLAIAKREGQELEMRVHPTLIPLSHLLSSVSGVNNAIYVTGDLAGGLLFYGPGAGQMSAASAVVSDIVDLCQDIKAGMFKSTLNITLDSGIKRLRRIDDIESRYYIRFMAVDKPGVLAKVSSILAKYGISIASVTQKERCRQEIVPIVMIVHEAKEKDLRQALDEIDRLNITKEKCVAIRMEEA